MSSNTDWFVDGHFISAPNANDARDEVKRLYGHDAEQVRPWTASDEGAAA